MANKYECDVCGHLYDEEKEKKIFKEEITPFCGSLRPGPFNTTGYSMTGLSAFETILPAKSHFL